MGGRSRLKNRVCLNVCNQLWRNCTVRYSDRSDAATHEHLPDEMAGRQADDQSYYHARKDGHDRLVYGPYALDLEVVRGAQRADE